MRQYIVQRVVSAIPVLLGVVTLVFVLMRVLPGAPTAVLAAQSGGSAEDAARLWVEYGLDRPLYVQYMSFLVRLLQGDLGRSFFTGQLVAQTIAQQAPPTLALATFGLAIAVGIGLPLGVLGAARPGSWLDRLCMGFSVASASLPIPLTGLLLILFFGLMLGWLPATGRGTLSHLVMPATVLGLSSVGTVARLARAQLAEALRQEYVQVARAKGLRERDVLLKHALRNALIPVTTVIGLQFGFMLGGAVATESVFARPGLGRTLVDAILYQDYPVVQGIVILSAVIYTGINLAVDLLHGYLDPRIHHE